MLSPDLFSLYIEVIMRNLERYPRMKVRGHNVNNLRYADDTVWQQLRRGVNSS